jgi:glutamyl-tRNA reductase
MGPGDTLREHPRAMRSPCAIIEAELAAYQLAIDAARVAPTVVGLRARAAAIVDAELARLAGRLGAEGVSGRCAGRIARTA